jgi:hypothetical protein
MITVKNDWKMVLLFGCIAFRHGEVDNITMIWYAVVDGANTCKVGYLAKEHQTEAHTFERQFLRMVDLYSDYDEEVIRHMLYFQKC